MADSRPSGLSEVLAAELASLYDSLVIPVDDPSYSAGDVKKIKAKTLLQAVNDAITTINNTLGNKANIADVLLKNNTVEFIPTGDYNPATNKQIKDIAMKLICKGTIGSAGNILSSSGITISSTRLGTGTYQITHNLNSSNYFVIAHTYTTTTGFQSMKVNTISDFTNYSVISISDDQSPNDWAFKFIILSTSI